jgi:hypothetical protein
VADGAGGPGGLLANLDGRSRTTHAPGPGTTILGSEVRRGRTPTWRMTSLPAPVPRLGHRAVPRRVLEVAAPVRAHRRGQTRSRSSPADQLLDGAVRLGRGRHGRDPATPRWAAPSGGGRGRSPQSGVTAAPREGRGRRPGRGTWFPARRTRRLRSSGAISPWLKCLCSG